MTVERPLKTRERLTVNFLILCKPLQKRWVDEADADLIELTVCAVYVQFISCHCYLWSFWHNVCDVLKLLQGVCSFTLSCSHSQTRDLALFGLVNLTLTVFVYSTWSALVQPEMLSLLWYSCTRFLLVSKRWRRPVQCRALSSAGSAAVDTDTHRRVVCPRSMYTVLRRVHTRATTPSCCCRLQGPHCACHHVYRHSQDLSSSSDSTVKIRWFAHLGALCGCRIVKNYNVCTWFYLIFRTQTGEVTTVVCTEGVVGLHGACAIVDYFYFWYFMRKLK